MTGAALLASAAVSLPNLLVAGAPHAPTHAGTTTPPISVRVLVQSTEATLAPRSRTRAYFSEDRRWTTADSPLGPSTVTTSIRARRAVGIFVSMKMPSEPSTGYLLICADSRRKVRERSERDNCWHQPLHVTAP